jgi:hypothetical protein
VTPGKYKIELVLGFRSHSVETEVLMDPRVKAAGVTLGDLVEQEKLSLAVQSLHLEARQFELYLKKQLEENETAIASEAIKAIQSEITTAEGRYPTPMLIDQISYLYSMLDQADQVPGKDAYDRYTTLREKLTALKSKTKAPGISD